MAKKKKNKTLTAASMQQMPELLDTDDSYPDDSLHTGPEVSPYLSSSCKVYFKGGQPFTIPYDLLRSSKKLQETYDVWHNIRLGDIPDEAGHVLIHYLHTGTWQTLAVESSTPAVIHSTLLNIGLHVYAAAQAYELPGLVELAKENISHHAGLLPDLETLVSASDAGRLLGEDDPWFSAFIRQRIRQLFEDPASLNKTGFLGCFDSATRYTRMLVKGLIDICCDNSTSVNPTASRPTSRFESYAASESGQEPVVGLLPGSTPAPSMGAPKPESESVVVSTPGSETARSAYSAQPEPESAVEVLPEPEAAPSNVIVEPKPGSAMDCTPIPPAEPVPNLYWPAWSSPVPAEIEAKPSAEVAAEPVPDFEWPEEPSPEPAEFEVKPSAKVVAEPEPVASAEFVPEPTPIADVATEPRPDSRAESILEPDPEPEPAAGTEELSYAQSKKDKKKAKKGKKGKKGGIPEDVCVWEATHLADGGWENCPSCWQYVSTFVSSHHQVKENNSLGI